MGLDMYLTKRTYIGACYEHNEVKGKISLEKAGVTIPIQLSRLESVNERVGYWRKANHIHKWMVDNIQEGNDDCGEYSLSYDKAKELHGICVAVMADHSKASELLPSQEGFFFGGTEYDEYYLQEVEYTVRILEELMIEAEESTSDPGKKYFPSDILYRSSW